METIDSIIDLRNHVKGDNFTVIEVDDNFVYYHEIRLSDDNERMIYINCYNRFTKKNNTLCVYTLNEGASLEHILSVDSDIILILQEEEGSCFVVKLNKQSGEEKGFSKLSFLGTLAEVVALSSEYLLLYTENDSTDDELFSEYHQMTGFNQIVYLYNIDSGEYQYLRDKHVLSHSASSVIKYENKASERKILFVEYNGSIKERYKAFKEASDSNTNPVETDLVMSIDFEDFIKTCRKSRSLKFDEKISAGLSGVLRFMGQDSKNIYFRALHFPTNEQLVLAVNKNTGEVCSVRNLSQEGGYAEYLIMTDGAYVFKIYSAGSEQAHIKGMINSTVDANFPRNIGTVLGCFEDRYILAKTKISSSSGEGFYSIFDLDKQKSQSFEANVVIKNGTALIY